MQCLCAEPAQNDPVSRPDWSLYWDVSITKNHPLWFWVKKTNHFEVLKQRRLSAFGVLHPQSFGVTGSVHWHLAAPLLPRTLIWDSTQVRMTLSVVSKIENSQEPNEIYIKIMVSTRKPQRLSTVATTASDTASKPALCQNSVETKHTTAWKWMFAEAKWCLWSFLLCFWKLKLFLRSSFGGSVIAKILMSTLFLN